LRHGYTTLVPAQTCETSAGGRIDLHVILVLDIEGETDVKLAVLIIILSNRIGFCRFPTYTLLFQMLRQLLNTSLYRVPNSQTCHTVVMSSYYKYHTKLNPKLYTLP